MLEPSGALDSSFDQELCLLSNHVTLFTYSRVSALENDEVCLKVGAVVWAYVRGVQAFFIFM